MAAILWALSSILEKKGLKDLDSLSGVLITLSVNFVIFWTVSVLFFSPIHFESSAVLLFILSGLLGAAFGRHFKFLGFDRVGVSFSRTIVASQPFFATTLAIAILGETLTFPVGIGTFLIFFGVAVLSQSGEKTRRWKRRWLLFPLFSAACYGAAAVVDKIGLNIFPSPVLGATVSISASFSVYASFFILSGKIRANSVNKRNFFLFCGAGVCTSAAIFCVYYALSLGAVIHVVPLKNTSPLFTLFFSHLFLRDVEKVTRKTVIAAILIVTGATITTCFYPL